MPYTITASFPSDTDPALLNRVITYAKQYAEETGTVTIGSRQVVDGAGKRFQITGSKQAGEVRDLAITATEPVVILPST